jgi:hypothetical protein
LRNLVQAAFVCAWEVVMRSAGNFHPDWGYLAPAPSFMRTARIVLVATAIGATAGAAVMISLMPHSATDAANAPIAAHALVTSVPVMAEAPAAAPLDEPMAAQTPAAPQMQAAVSPPASKSNMVASGPAKAPGSVATLAGSSSSPVSATAAGAEAQPAASPDETVTAPEPASKQTKKHRTAGYDPTRPAAKKWANKRPFDPLFHLFSSSSGPRDSF